MYCDVLGFRASSARQLLYGKNLKGIHPWDLESSMDQAAMESLWNDFLRELDQTNRIDALGECGLDRARANLVSINAQIAFLGRHFELARQRNIPLVLHIVRSYSDLLGFLKQEKNLPRFTLHGFNGNRQEVEQFLKYDVYFSFGKSLFQNEEIIKNVPLENLLLESGAQEEYLIEDIYLKAAEILNMSLEKLQERVELNFNRFLSKFHN